MWPSRHKYQDSPGRPETAGKLFDSAAYINGQPLSAFPKFRDTGGIRIMANHGKALAGNGQNQVTAEETESEDTDGAILVGIRGIRHGTAAHYFPAGIHYGAESGAMVSTTCQLLAEM